MKVLVTGSSGWLGRHLIPLLKEMNHDPVGLDPAASPWTDVVGSVADKSMVQDLFEQYAFDGVIHAGALHKPDIVRNPAQSFIDVNVTGTLNLLEQAISHKCTGLVFTSTTSLMISQKIRDERMEEAVWLDEDAGPLEPRNIYGVTKLAAEGLCRQHHITHGLNVITLRTARFFPEEDDTLTDLSGPNLKSNEFLNRRASVHDIARAHIAALEQLHIVKCGLYIVSAPTPFSIEHVGQLKQDPAALIREMYPEVQNAYEQEGWELPQSIGRVYDGRKITRDLNFTYKTKFQDIVDALTKGHRLPLDHDPTYTSPLL